MTTEFYDPKFIKNNPWQTRSREPDADYIKELALDIKKNGLLQVPIGRIISINGAGTVQLAFGHNRLRAYLYLSLPMMPVDVRALTDEQMAAFAWSENEKRRNVTAIERAKAIQQRITDFKWTNRQAAEALGVDHSTVSNLLRLLKLPEELQTANMEGKLSERQIEALLTLFDLPPRRDPNFSFWSYSLGGAYLGVNAICKMALDKGLSSDHIRIMVNDYIKQISVDLKDAEFKLDQLIPEGNDVYCGLCKTCDQRMASQNLCFDRGCFKAKTEYVHREYLLKAKFATGYPLDDVEKCGYPSTLPDYDKKVRERIIASKCPNLVLIYQNGAKDIEGYPNVRLVCTKRNNSCSCIKGLNVLSHQGNLPAQVASPVITMKPSQDGQIIVETITVADPPVVTSDELEEAARQARREKMAMEKQMEEIEKKLAKHLLQAIEMYQPGAFYIAIHGKYFTKSELYLKKIFEYLANEGARRLMPIGADNIEQLIKWINEDLKRLELEPFSLEETKPAAVDVVESSIPVL